MNHEVTVILRHLSSRTRIEGLSANVVSYDSFSEVNDIFANVRPEIVINTVGSYGRRSEKLDSLVEANIYFPSQLFSTALANNVETFIHTGTSLPDKISLYALTKNTFTKAVSKYDTVGMQFINIALEHFYGPGDDDKKFAAWVLKKCISNDTLQLTSGIQQRDFIYIDDVLSAYEVILMNKSGLGKSQTISVGSGCPTSLRHFVETIHKYTQSRSTLEFGALPLREEESMYSCADIRELSRLEWKAKFTLEQGIASMIKGLDQ
jgi:CDP-paratose synthetase